MKACSAVLTTVLLAVVVSACGDSTGPSKGGFWSEASGRYRLTYMSGAQPPWRYVAPGSAISTDVDSVMLRLHPDGNYAIDFYLRAVHTQPTYKGYWASTDGALTFLPLGKGSMTMGSLNGDKATISTVSALMPGLSLPNGTQTDFEFHRAGNDREITDSFIKARLLTGDTFGAIAVTADNTVLALAAAQHHLIRAAMPFRMPPPITDMDAAPTDMILAPDGTAMFMAELADGIGIYDIVTGQPTGRIRLSGAVKRIRANGSGLFATVGYQYGTDSVFRIDPATHMVATRALAPKYSTGLAVTEDGMRVYVGSSYGTVEEFDGATLDSLRTLAIPTTGGALTLSADGRTIYISHNDFVTSGLEAWDLATNTMTLHISVPGDIFDIARQPGTGQIYVSRGTYNGIGSVYRINPADPADESVIVTRGQPQRIAFTAEGNPVVANAKGWIDVLQ